MVRWFLESLTAEPVDPRAQFISLVGGVVPGIVGFRVPGVLKPELACYRQEEDPPYEETARLARLERLPLAAEKLIKKSKE